jgi:hypothetical protein
MACSLAGQAAKDGYQGKPNIGSRWWHLGSAETEGWHMGGRDCLGICAEPHQSPAETRQRRTRSSSYSSALAMIDGQRRLSARRHCTTSASLPRPAVRKGDEVRFSPANVGAVAAPLNRPLRPELVVMRRMEKLSGVGSRPSDLAACVTFSLLASRTGPAFGPRLAFACSARPGFECRVAAIVVFGNFGSG